MAVTYLETRFRRTPLCPPMERISRAAASRRNTNPKIITTFPSILKVKRCFEAVSKYETMVADETRTYVQKTGSSLNY